jgi:hypothetical protein
MATSFDVHPIDLNGVSSYVLTFCNELFGLVTAH